MNKKTKKKLVPFYRYQEKGTQGYTLLVDKHSERVFKVYHSNGNSGGYWIAFFLVLALMRAIQNVHLPINNPLNLVIVILSGIISLIIGVAIYKFYYRDLMEIYPTKDMIEDYVEEARDLLKKEVITAIFVFLGSVVFFILFMVNYRLLWLLFSFGLLACTVIALCGLPKERFELYKKGVR